MTLFKKINDNLREISEKKIELEKHVQKLSEDNLSAIFGLEFIATEFEHDGLRLDTLAFDASTNAFVIIEYKRDRSFSVVDQGYAYLSLLLNNKAEFILLYQQQTGRQIAKDEIDWSQSRVMFVAQGFTIHQQQAINFRDMPIELWRVKWYEQDLILFDQIKPKATSQSIKTVSKDPEVQKVSNQVKVHDVMDHFTGKKQDTLSLYESLRDKLIEIVPDAHENPRGGYIGFSLRENGNDTFIYINVQVGALRLVFPRINPEDVGDTLGYLKLVPNSVEYKGTPESLMHAKNEDDILYATALLRQILKLKFKR